MRKGYWDCPVNAVQTAGNRDISSKRWVVERTIVKLKQWFALGSVQLKDGRRCM